MHSTLTSKGQITIPKPIRERLGLRAGDRLDFKPQGDGTFVVERSVESPLGRLPGLLRSHAPDQPVSVDAMREAVRRRARERSR